MTARPRLAASRLRHAISLACAAAFATALTAQGGGLAPAGTYAVADLTIDNFVAVHGVPVDVKVYRPIGGPTGAAAPLLVYGPGGGSGSAGQIAAVPQHDLLWRRLASAGMTVAFLQNEQETAPGRNFWQLRGDVVLWVLANTATLNAAFGSQVAAQSPVVVAGWSLGAATVVQHVGADFGFGAYADLRVRGAVLFANPAVGAYGGVITTAGLAQVDKPTLAILGTDDLGQPGSFPPGTLPATSPRGLGVQAMLGGPSSAVFGVCFTGANHFEYGAQAAVAGSENAARIEVINGHVFAFVDLALRGMPDCGAFATSSWPGAGVAWSAQRCTPPIVRTVGTGCAASGGEPAIAGAGGPPRVGNPAFAIALAQAPAGALFATALAAGDPLPLGVAIPGAPACALLFAASADLRAGFADATGNAWVAVPVPADPALAGARLAAQHAVFDPAFPPFAGLPLPIGTSAALAVAIGN
jgi:hypothetical protein